MRKRIEPARALFVLSSAMAIFAYGFIVGAGQVFPFYLLRSGLVSFVQVWNDRFAIVGARFHTRPEEFVRAARYDGDGVVRDTADRMEPGLTLLSGFFDDTNELRLIRSDGSIVQQWPVHFSQIFPDPDHIEPASSRPATDWNTDIHGAIALPDGSVVFNFEYHGLVKLDRCGGLVWTVRRMTHHSVQQASDGGFWVGGRRYVEALATPNPLTGPHLEDTLLKISPDGAIVTEVSVPGLFFSNDLAHLLLAGIRRHDYRVLEPVHLNDIEELSPKLAERFPQWDAGDLLVSLRYLNMLMVVDPVSEVVKWHQVGPWIRQHDPDFRPDGTISVFNNNTDYSETGSIFGGSTIVAVDPTTGRTTTLYGAAAGQAMYTDIRGRHQHLDSGGMLITESASGRVFETDSGGKIVWEFINRYDDDEVARVNDATRYDEHYFTVDDWDCGSP